MFTKTKDEKALQEVRNAEKELLRRREFCVQQATYCCDERPGDIVRTAEAIYNWIYGARV